MLKMSLSCLNLIRIRNIKLNAKKVNGIFLENPIFMVFLWGLITFNPNKNMGWIFYANPYRDSADGESITFVLFDA